LLLCRLSERVGMNPGCWTLPGGGLDFGEDPEDAVIREFKEETGLIVKVHKLVAVNSLCDSMPGWSPMHSIRIIRLLRRKRCHLLILRNRESRLHLN